MSTNASAFDTTAAFNFYFGFNRKPFPTRFDSECFCSNPRYDIIYNHLSDGIRQHQGVTALTGEAGTGKTFMLRKLMQDAGEDVIFVFHNYFTDLNFDDLLGTICEELNLATAGSSRLEKLNALSEFLNTCLATNKSAVLVIDEAHKLDDKVIHYLFDLSGLGSKNGCFLQVLLSGLPLLGEKLNHCKATYPLKIEVSEKHLEPFTDAEVAGYIRQQLQFAGGLDNDLFPEAVLSSIACYVRVPRLINMFCDHALRLAQEDKQTRISPEMISEIAELTLLSNLENHKPVSPGYDAVPPVTIQNSETSSPTAGTFVQTGLQFISKPKRALVPVTLKSPNALDGTAERIGTLPTVTPKRAAIDGGNRRPQRRLIWAALLLMIAIGATGGYAVQQRYGLNELAVAANQALENFRQNTPPPSPPEPAAESPDMTSVAAGSGRFDEISVTAKRTLEAFETQWSSMASKIMAKVEALKADTLMPPPSPRSIQDTPAQSQAADIASMEVPPVTYPLEAGIFFEPLSDIDLNPPPPPALEEISEPVAPKSNGSQGKLQNEIARLLALAEASRRDYRLTTPANDSAVYYYRKVLQLDPKNPYARRGFSKVVNAYRNLAWQHLRRDQYGRARMFVNRGLALAPNNTQLLTLQQRVNREAASRRVGSFPSGRINYRYSYADEQGFNRK